ncbi:MAG: transposase [Oligoflexia bacterium]|nr:transposase [Oligoflexia bacterium]
MTFPFFLSIYILSTVFRGKFLDYLKQSFLKSKLVFMGENKDLGNVFNFDLLLESTKKNEWVVYTKKPFANPQQVIEYVGQYTHRVAISNHRIIKSEINKVHFKYRDYADGNKIKIMILDAIEFMRRFLLHVLPSGFVRIRHFGILANRPKKEKLAISRKILNAIEIISTVLESLSWKEMLYKFTGIDINICPKCKKGKLIIIESIQSCINTS